MDLLTRYRAGLNPLSARPGQYPYALYNYTPNQGLNIFAALFFGLAMLAHAWWSYRYPRTRGIQGFMTLFCAWELTLYIMRNLCNFNPFREELFNAQYVMGLVGPTWLIIALLLAFKTSPLSSASKGARSMLGRSNLIVFALIGYQTFIFLWTLISTPIWTVGNTNLLIGITPSYQPDIARQIVIAGLANQVAQLTLFQALNTWALISLFKHKGASAPATATERYDLDRGIGSANHRNTGQFHALLFLTVGMVWARSIFRLVEVIQDMFGTAWSSELYYGLFEFALVWAPAVIWAVRPVALYLGETYTGRATAIANHKASTGAATA